MGQLTREFVLDMLAKTDPDGHCKHYPLTVWEEHQLAHAWLQRDEMQEQLRELEADARRYRYLVNMAWGKPIGEGYHDLVFRTFLIRERWTDTKAVADAAIDAAMSGK